MGVLTYCEVLRESVQKFAALPCLHIKRNATYQTWTYQDFHQDLNRTAQYLKNQGVKRGTHIVVIGPNTPEWAIAYHAAILANGCTVPLDPNLPRQEIMEICRITEPMVVFCSHEYIGLFQEIHANISTISSIVNISTEVPSLSNSDKKEVFSIANILSQPVPEHDYLDEIFSPDDTCAVLFTSGTTGKAKGAELLQKNFLAPSQDGIARMHLSAEDTLLAVLPLHHVFGFAACLAATLSAGMDIVFVPEIKGPLIIEAINERRVSVLPAVPQMLELFYESIMRKVSEKGFLVLFIFSILKFISATAGPVLGRQFRKKLFNSVHQGFGGNLSLFVSGGSSLKARYFNGFRLLGFDIVEGYGLTETFGPITLCPRTKPTLGSVGPVLGNNSIKIINPDKYGIGEVCFKGSTVFKGYYKNEAATQAVFDEDGWFHTGDLGRLNRQDFLFLTGRSKDLIVLDSGKNVYPEELEEFYLQSKHIEEIGIFGVTENSHEIVCAVILPAKKLLLKYTHEKVEEIIYDEINRLGKSLPTYKKVGSYVLTRHPLPRTSTKKIKKKELSLYYSSAKKNTQVQHIPDANLSFLETALTETNEYQFIVEQIQLLTGNTKQLQFSPRANLALDLRIDSLKKLDLVCAIEEEFGLEINSERFASRETLGDFTSLVQELKSEQSNVSESQIAPIKKRIVSESLQQKKLPKGNPAIYGSVAFITNTVSRSFWGLKVSGVEHIRRGKPILFAANHASALDPFWLAASLPPAIRKNTYSVGKNELTQIPILSSILTGCNMIPVDRFGDVTEALKISLAVLQQGNNLIIFPEGTRSPDGSLINFKSGLGTLVIESNAVVIPVKISGAFEIWGNRKFPYLFSGRRFNPSITFGKSYTGKELGGTDFRKKAPEEISDAVRNILLKM